MDGTVIDSSYSSRFSNLQVDKCHRYDKDSDRFRNENCDQDRRMICTGGDYYFYQISQKYKKLNQLLLLLIN
jgi:hypothetical protein